MAALISAVTVAVTISMVMYIYIYIHVNIFLLQLLLLVLTIKRIMETQMIWHAPCLFRQDLPLRRQCQDVQVEGFLAAAKPLGAPEPDALP